MPINKKRNSNLKKEELNDMRQKLETNRLWNITLLKKIELNEDLLMSIKRDVVISEKLNRLTIATNTVGLICTLIGTLIISWGVDKVTNNLNLELNFGYAAFVGGVAILFVLAFILKTKEEALMGLEILLFSAFIFLTLTILTLTARLQTNWYLVFSAFIPLIYLLLYLYRLRFPVINVNSLEFK